MVNKTVMKVDMECYKCKRIALKSVTEIEGIDSVEFNMKDKTITVLGDADPVCMANELRRKFKCATLISYGPSPPPPPQQPKPQNKAPEKESKGEPKNEKGSKGEPKNEKGSKGEPKSEKEPNKQSAKNPSTDGKPPDVVPIICYPPYTIHGGYNAAPHCCCGWSPCSCRSEIDFYVVNEETPPCTIC